MDVEPDIQPEDGGQLGSLMYPPSEPDCDASTQPSGSSLTSALVTGRPGAGQPPADTQIPPPPAEPIHAHSRAGSPQAVDLNARPTSHLPSPPIQRGEHSPEPSGQQPEHVNGEPDIPPALLKFFSTLNMPVHSAADIFIKYGLVTDDDLDMIACAPRAPYDDMEPFIRDLIDRINVGAWIAVEAGFVRREKALLQRGLVCQL